MRVLVASVVLAVALVGWVHARPAPEAVVECRVAPAGGQLRIPAEARVVSAGPGDGRAWACWVRR